MRREHLVKQHLMEKRSGLVPDYRIPDEVTYLRPTIAETYEKPPLPTQAARIPSDKSPFNTRGSRYNPLSGRMIVAESALEIKAGKILATKDVVELREQWPRVAYVDRHGVKCSHTFDLWARKSSGKRVAIAIKPLEKIDQEEFFDKLLRIKDAGIDGHADDVSFITEFYASEYAAANAEEILFARRTRNENDVEETKALLREVKGKILFGELLKGLEIQAYRRVALWCLVDEGWLRPVRPSLIEDHTLMEVLVPSEAPSWP
ncbi:hypothetical protein CO662_32815 [Rhizobium anhuiense]|uniref:TnsA endonuclease N-terminal domain-containing protein n=1 Tax=Rhizobium anhuiense TaxID=1184720 RepID=A0ABX4J112_9HYPH|nr:hypothetical protein [Rhizobium anhuiense]PDS40851.1 hypothetical protein CO668_31980 [Rhizobium anhuiense]PDS47823.1 hypothetical protein CO662_32815 [Rhizobium anhuiense]